MEATVVGIRADHINDWDSFHDVFALAMGFPSFYGRNLDAWIDCLTCLDDSASGMTTVWPPAGQVLTLRIEGASSFRVRCPEQFEALIDCAAFVNRRREEIGERAVLAIDLVG